VTELFFGRDIAGRAPLSDLEWSRFAASAIATEFPDGFTVLDGEGEWRDPATHTMVRERTKILLVASVESDDTAARIARISEGYRRSFAQTSVGVLGFDACGAF
jgi:hypothetical protein